MVRALRNTMVRRTLHTSGLAKMWDINMDTEVQVEEVLGSKIYTVENVYKFPDKVARFLFNRETAWHKVGEPWSLNAKKFEDRRLCVFDNQAVPLFWLVTQLSSQSLHSDHIETNVMRILDDPFNDIKNNYWWPHLDNGYNGIVYFNKNDKLNGTNLYHPKVKEEEFFKEKMDPNTEWFEHQNPWIDKSKYEIVKYIEPAYNKLVLFDGAFFPHGAAITDKKYFTDNIHKKAHWSNYRVNQVFFLNEKINTHGKKEKN